MMSKPLLIFALTVLVGSPLFAQENYLPASVVTLSGDTVKGQIDYKNWNRNPSAITFKENDNAEAISYDPSMIRSFAVANDVYKSAIVEIDKRYDDLRHISSDATIVTHTDTVFLNLVVGGSKPLYQFYDNVHHFYIESGKNIELLKFRKYLTRRMNYATASEERVVGIVDIYTFQLEEYLKECPSISKMLADTKYDVLSLRKTFLNYYKCAGSEPAYTHKKELEKLEIGLLAGATSTSLNVTTTEAAVIARVDFPSSQNFTGGVFFDIILPRQRSRLSINNEFLYTSYKTSGTWKTSSSDTRYDEYRFAFDYAYLKINNMARYKFLLKNATIFINAGVSNGLALKAEYSSRLFHKYDEYESDREQPKDHTKKHEIGFFIGAGARKNRGSLELRAERSDGMFHFSEVSSKVMRYSVLFGYRLK